MGFLLISFSLSSDSNEFLFHICLLNSIPHLYFSFPISFVFSWEKLKETEFGFVQVTMYILWSQKGQKQFAKLDSANTDNRIFSPAQANVSMLKQVIKNMTRGR